MASVGVVESVTASGKEDVVEEATVDVSESEFVDDDSDDDDSVDVSESEFVEGDSDDETVDVSESEFVEGDSDDDTVDVSELKPASGDCVEVTKSDLRGDSVLVDSEDVEALAEADGAGVVCPLLVN